MSRDDSGEGRTKAEVSPLRVLVIDDEDEPRRLLALAVRSFGLACDEAENGDRAWTMFERASYDIVISDWHMPETDGLELCDRIRSSEARGAPYTYFILVTGMGGDRGFRRGMDAGADDYQTKPVDLEELQARLVSATRVVRTHRSLEHKTSLLRRDSQRALQSARTDALTNVSNRLGLETDLGTVWAQSRRYGHRFALAMCDVDNFKPYNDEFGHLAGDDALRKIASVLRENVRDVDKVYRYGGEEFLVLLPEQSEQQAAIAMERVREAVVCLALPAANNSGCVTISIGLAELDASRDGSIAEWIQRADQALYRAKGGGKNRVVQSQSTLPTHGSRG